MEQKLQTQQKYKAQTFYIVETGTREKAEAIRHPCVRDIDHVSTHDSYYVYKMQEAYDDDLTVLIYQVSAQIGCIYQAYDRVKIGRTLFYEDTHQMMTLTEDKVQELKIKDMLSKE